MRNKLLFIIAVMLVCFSSKAQIDSVDVEIDEVFVDTIVTDTADIILSDNIITNTSALNLFFEKLYQVEQEKKGQINIVHIGDSHIAADLFSGAIRKRLQERFGNAGCGFSFPYSLAKTNGSHFARYTSNVSWGSRKNISVPDGTIIGLSGIGLYTKEDFAIEINTRDNSYDFNTIKIITPGNKPMFDVATSSKEVKLESKVPKKINHRIKSGEVLGTIAEKYNISVSQLKKANGLKSDNIRAGRTLKIPTREMQKKVIKRSEFIPLGLEADSLSHFYHSNQPLSKLYLLPNKSAKEYNLSGLVLEKDDAGILYHSIGVNGAKSSDYNKYPLFFEQLPALKPDLLVISLGTNESFDKMTAADFMVQLTLFIENVRAKNPDVCIVVTTPSPSLFKRKYPNTFAADYSKNIMMQETQNEYASWDMYTVMGGLFGVPRNAAKGLIAKDRVHYTRDGYEKQGRKFTEAFLNAYNNFKTNRK